MMKPALSINLGKTLLTIFLSVVMLGLGLHFIFSEGVGFAQINYTLAQTDRRWLYIGMGFSALYVWLHGEMYSRSFRALGIRTDLRHMTRLFLKRNLFSVFLPAGFLSSQALFTSETARLERVREQDVMAASGIFAASALLSMVVVVVPALGWLFAQQVLPGGAVEAFLTVSALFLALLVAVVNFAKHGAVYRWSRQYLPSLTTRLDVLNWSRFEARFFIQAILYSCLVELVGVFHVWIAVQALGLAPTLPMAVVGYLAVLVILMTSPFLRGAGAVEALLGLVLIRFGLPATEALSAAVLFRFFEFWLILMFALPVLLVRPGNLFVRMAPSMLLFALGIVNILSTLTPALPARVSVVSDYLSFSAIHASAALTLVSGFFLLITAFYLFQGFRSAWWVALVLSAVSLVSHMSKGLDYEEATLALLASGALLYQQSEYNVRTDMRLLRRRWIPAVAVTLTVLIVGTVGFYLLDHKHFGQDFTWGQSAGHALRSFLLQQPQELQPMTTFGMEFLDTMYLLGGMLLLFVAYTLFRPLLPQFEDTEQAREAALSMIRQYGNSSLDYFKTYSDKHFFFPRNGHSFVSYKHTRRYAFVLGDPVAQDASVMQDSISEFDSYCRHNGLRSIYYRIPEASAPQYRALGKSLLPLGQEATLDLTGFTLEGKERKSLRNAVHKMEREGYVFGVHEPPLSGRLLQQLRAVSDAWLRMLGRSELNFSQGVFNECELKNQAILTLEDAEGKILAFINLIPGTCASEANFDLMRRVEEAPPGTMDFLFVKMFLYLKSKGFATCNLGLVPFSGMERPASLPESLIKLAYERLPRFAAYKSLRYFKEKFDPVWETKYVAFDSQMDLINLPTALAKVVREGAG